MKKTTNFGYESDKIEEGICWFARSVWENLLYSSYLSTSGTHLQYKWIIHAATLCTRAGQGNKLLSEMVMIKSNIKPQPVQDACFIDSDDIDS